VRYQLARDVVVALQQCVMDVQAAGSHSLAEDARWDQLCEASAERYERLRHRLRDYGSVLVAYSGGCDSAFLLRVATDVLGPHAMGLTAIGESLAPDERTQAGALAREMGAVQVEIESHEIDNPLYAANPTDRCYHCKTELYDLALAEAKRRGIPHVVSGTNADELGDYRPGLRAAAEHAVSHPMAEVGLTKDHIRAWSRRLGLRTWDKPQTPCLSSRLPYGTAVTRERLAMVGAAEASVRAAGFRVFRVRHHELAAGGALARVEIASTEMGRVADPEVRRRVQLGVMAAGYAFATIDAEPFRSGRLNEAAGLVQLAKASELDHR
jgi:uncharacterized protein